MASHTHLRQTHAAGTDGTAAKSTVIIRKPGPGSDCSYCPARRVYGWALQSSTLAAAQPEVRVQPTHPASTLSQRRACTLTSSLSTLGAPAPPLRPTATAARRGSQTRGSCRCSRPPGSPAHASRSSAVLLSWLIIGSSSHTPGCAKGRARSVPFLHCSMLRLSY